MNKKGKTYVALGGLLVVALMITGVTVHHLGKKGIEKEKTCVDQAIKTEERKESKTEEQEEEKEEETEHTSAQVEKQEVALQEPVLDFTESSLMEWPVNGQIVLDYNMDHTVYFPTLNVYKWNPAVAISAEEGTPVAAVANGKILSIAENEETGITMTVDMGNGYQAIYGQLKDVPFQAEDYVSAGTVIGCVNQPTKYYIKEGANLYFAMKKDGISLDPMQYLP